MKKHQKLLISAFLLFFIFGFINVKTAEAITAEDKTRIIEEIKAQLVIIIEKIAEIQRQLNEIIESEEANEEISVVDSISFVSPKGKEKWEVGKNYEIQWTTSGYSSNLKVKIKLIDDRYDQNYIAYELSIAETDNNGAYNWRVPDLLNGYALYGSLYKISVSIGEGDDEKTDTSNNYFTIAQAIPSYLNIISPNGGEILKVGETHTIKWDSLGTENYKASIMLKKSDINYLTVVENIPNNNFYDWEVNQGLYGTDYKILINTYDSSENLVVWDLSNYNFTIIQQ